MKIVWIYILCFIPLSSFEGDLDEFELDPILGSMYQLDKGHSLMDFTVKHVGFGRVRGTFNDYRVCMHMPNGQVAKASVTAVINVNTLDTGNPGRDDHLKNVFFDVEQFPNILFQSNQVRQEAGEYIMQGQLTVKDVTRTVELPLSIEVLEGTDQWENKRIVIDSELVINRNDYNVIYSNEFWNGIVGDEIKIDISFAGQYYNALNNIFPWRKNSIATVIKNTFESEGIDAAIAHAKNLFEANSEEFQFGLNHFYRAGWAVGQQGYLREGIQIFDLAIELLGDHLSKEDLSDLYASSAEMYRALGDEKQALSSIEKAYTADPVNPYVMELRRNVKL